jgi:hypothetical protein
MAKQTSPGDKLNIQSWLSTGWNHVQKFGRKGEVIGGNENLPTHDAGHIPEDWNLQHSCIYDLLMFLNGEADITVNKG